MTDHNIIDIVVAELTKYPSVKFQKGKNDELKFIVMTNMALTLYYKQM